MMAEAQRELADYCLYLPENSRTPCYKVAGYVVVRPSGEVLSYTCEEHREAWSARIQGAYVVMGRAEWEETGAGYRGPMLGG